MRNSALWMLAATAAVAVACVAGGAVAQEAPGKPAAAVSADTLRDVEVMRRVLVREGLGGGGATRTDEFNSTWLPYGAQQASASEAYVVAGGGVTFLLRTSDPVAPSAAQAQGGEAAAEPSAWEEAEAEVVGQPRLRRARVGPDRYDVAKVEALRGRLLEQLAKFGHKVRGLGAGDHLTVVVVGAARGATLVAIPPETGGVVDEKGRLLERRGAGDARAALLALGTYTTATSTGTPTVLTIRVAVADCQACARGEMNVETFRHRAVVSAY